MSLQVNSVVWSTERQRLVYGIHKNLKYGCLLYSAYQSNCQYRLPAIFPRVDCNSQGWVTAAGGIAVQGLLHKSFSAGWVAACSHMQCLAIIQCVQRG